MKTYSNIIERAEQCLHIDNCIFCPYFADGCDKKHFVADVLAAFQQIEDKVNRVYKQVRELEAKMTGQ